jgi:hypothetical protein
MTQSQGLKSACLKTRLPPFRSESSWQKDKFIVFLEAYQRQPSAYIPFQSSKIIDSWNYIQLKINLILIFVGCLTFIAEQYNVCTSECTSLWPSGATSVPLRHTFVKSSVQTQI